MQTLAQFANYRNYFSPPIDTVLLLSGNFGELRANHLHSGIDIKVFEQEGLPVLAAADGFIVRVKVSPVGFGKALYIDHPNGFTSVYGHLQRFNNTINAYVKEEQYKRESFELDVFPGKDRFLVKKGDTIGYAGNSGSSFGPHLHFEIRDTYTERPINPLYFNFPIKDTIAPAINLLRIYPFNDSSFVNNSNSPMDFIISKDSLYKPELIEGDTIQLAGSIGFGIETYDYIYNKNDKSGIYSMQLFIDSVLCFYCTADSFAFDETRYANSLIDYNYWMKTGIRVYRTYIQPENKLSLYDYVYNSGIFSFCDNLLHSIRIEVADFNGNTAQLAFTVRGKLPYHDLINLPYCNEDVGFFIPEKDNIFENENISIFFPKGCLYDTLHFSYASEHIPKGCFSALHCIHNVFTPLHKNILVRIKVIGLPSKYINKTHIVKIQENGDKITCGGEWENGYIKTKIVQFGNYSVVVDTIPPIIKVLNLSKRKYLKTQKTLEFEIKDSSSGIKTYRGTINGHWILMDYDAKNDKLIYFIDEKIVMESNKFKLVVTDNCNNIRIFSTQLYYNKK